ncbi:MAG: hypothetical protein KIT52_16940, partial [Anaerolineae bacterium]|nr:hypothetical protein [Anaerolineae bacterium]
MLILVLAACRREPDTALTPTVAALPTSPATTAASSASSGIFIPVAPGEAAGQTPVAGAAYPAPVGATATPAPPTPTPEPEFPTYTGPPLDRDQIGIQVYLHRQDVRELLRHFEALNVGWVKVQVSWKLHEPRPGEYSEELFGELDRLIAGANGQG